MLEAELSDIQERYFHMSLKYAEVEAERLFHNLRKEVNGLRIGLEMRIAQLESEKSSLLQKEVGLMEETKRLLSEKEILSLKVENLLGKINLLESDLSFFVENEALAALVLKTALRQPCLLVTAATTLSSMLPPCQESPLRRYCLKVVQ
ncbi:hypothetical protein Ahy_B08g090952 isoform K [Arachis hypogaea]|uniref:Uncharacterized protein n=1 Tax=Arachis hypogaea TaxID=3818 RepID=A0A444Y100_ARAHY|nr:hypothetical protein Ahy_B08g090952 isoform K [Arachis hypogaea]